MNHHLLMAETSTEPRGVAGVGPTHRSNILPGRRRVARGGGVRPGRQGATFKGRRRWAKAPWVFMGNLRKHEDP